MVIFDSKYLISVYEELRSCVLGGHYTFSQPPGLDLFLKKGFLKWTQVQKETGVRTMPAKEPAAVKEPGSLSCGIEQEIILILANMILERTGNVSDQWPKTKSNSSGAQRISLYQTVNTAPGI